MNYNHVLTSPCCNLQFHQLVLYMWDWLNTSECCRHWNAVKCRGGGFRGWLCTYSKWTALEEEETNSVENEIWDPSHEALTRIRSTRPFLANLVIRQISRLLFVLHLTVWDVKHYCSSLKLYFPGDSSLRNQWLLWGQVNYMENRF